VNPDIIKILDFCFRVWQCTGYGEFSILIWSNNVIQFFRSRPIIPSECNLKKCSRAISVRWMYLALKNKQRGNTVILYETTTLINPFIQIDIIPLRSTWFKNCVRWNKVNSTAEDVTRHSSCCDIMVVPGYTMKSRWQHNEARLRNFHYSSNWTETFRSK
jgi:hypothetical protein